MAAEVRYIIVAAHMRVIQFITTIKLLLNLVGLEH